MRDPPSAVRDPDDEVDRVGGDGDPDGREGVARDAGVVLDGGAHGVLEQLGEDVVQGHLHVGKAGARVALHQDTRSVPVPVKGEGLQEILLLLDKVFQAELKLDDADLTRLSKICRSFKKEYSIQNGQMLVPGSP